MKGWEPIGKKDQTVILDECPFCHNGETLFLANPGFKYLMLVHWPLRGVHCPARFEQVCDDQAQGASWWNDRAEKRPLDLPEPPDDSAARSLKISKTPPVKPI